jgi:hypothetical protein
MDRLTENKIILVVRPTRLDDLVARFNTEAQARFYVEHLGADFGDYAREHARYRAAVAAAQASLARLGRVQVLQRAFVPNFCFGEGDTVVVLGQDGLVANVLKYLDRQPVVGVNPDPERWDGVLLPFRVDDLPRIVPEVFAGRRPIKEVTMAQARLSTGEVLYGVNDLFVGPRSHTSARYTIALGRKSEQQSSSGIIVSTGLGSTGWLRSILAGAAGVAGYWARREVRIDGGSLPWDADYLYYTVREPFPSKTTAATLTFGKITPEEPLRLVSLMPEHGVIFSDGIESDFLQFNSGVQATISVAQRRGHLVA